MINFVMMSFVLMNFVETVTNCPVVITEGAIIERIRRDPTVELDPHAANAALIYTPAGRAALEGLYRQYLDVGRACNLPMIVLTPTWRANPDGVRQAGLGDFNTVNGDCARFIAAIRGTYGSYAGRVFIGGLMGCRGDAYDPEEALSTKDAAGFHRAQAQALAEAGVDFLMASTLPAFSEALGMAMAMAETELPYVLGFVLRPTGTLLDGTPLHQAVARIDAAVHPRPFAYMGTCTHPTTFEQALARELEKSETLIDRIIGLQANASAKSPEELDGSAQLETEAPDTFARAMLRVHERFGIKVLGGCCGTDHRHIERVAELAKQVE